MAPRLVGHGLDRVQRHRNVSYPFLVWVRMEESAGHKREGFGGGWMDEIGVDVEGIVLVVG